VNMERLAFFLPCFVEGHKLPDFSWDTLPVAWHSSITTDFTSDDLQNLARYPLVTFEKDAGSHIFNWPSGQPYGLPVACQNLTDLSTCGCCEEDNMVRQATALKAINPDVHIVAYMNSVISYPWYRAAHKHVTNESWWLRDINGSLLNNIKENSIESWLTWDFSVPEVGDLWAEACLNLTNSGVIDGCFMDGCANWDHAGEVDGKVIVPGPLSQDKHDLYKKQKPEWMARLQQQTPGILVCGSGGGFVEGVEATQVQNWGIHSQDYAGMWIPMLQRAMHAGVVFEAHAACGSSDPTDANEVNKLAAFLVAAGRGAYYMCGGWRAGSVDWFPLYDLPLGEPLSNSTLGSDGIYRREFAKGTSVIFDTNTNTGNITWGAHETSV